MGVTLQLFDRNELNGNTHLSNLHVLEMNDSFKYRDSDPRKYRGICEFLIGPDKKN